MADTSARVLPTSNAHHAQRSPRRKAVTATVPDAYRGTSRRTRISAAQNCVEMCKVASKPAANTDVYRFISRGMLWREVVESIARGAVSVPLGERRQIRFPSVLLHPPPLAFEFSASYGEMSRRSGEAAKADNHSDSLRVFRINNLQSRPCREQADCDNSARWQGQFVGTLPSLRETFAYRTLPRSTGTTHTRHIDKPVNPRAGRSNVTRITLPGVRAVSGKIATMPGSVEGMP